MLWKAWNSALAYVSSGNAQTKSDTGEPSHALQSYITEAEIFSFKS